MKLQADSLAPFQFGPTGIFCEWDGGINYNHNDGDNFVTVTSVQSGGPSNGIIQVGDKIYAVNGTQLSSSQLLVYGGYRKDPRPAMGDAITESEAGDGKLVLDIERDGVRQDITVQLLMTNTAYSPTWPENCPKSDLIVQTSVDRIVSQINDLSLNNTRGLPFGTLLLLGTGDDQYLDELEYLMDNYIGVPNADPTDGNARTNWYTSLSAIAVSEYYIRTGDADVLPYLQFHVDHAFETDAVGGWGHGYPTGYPNPGYVFGGLVNACGGQMFISVCLARECGIDMADEDFERTLRYYYAFAAVAAPEYGDHRPGDGGAHNGKTSEVGIGVSLLNEPYHSFGRFVGAQDAMNTPQFQGGHTGNYPNLLWRAISLGLVPDERADAYRFSMDYMRWYLELSRGYDGSFRLLPAYEETRYADSTWGMMMPLYFISWKNTLRMTGAPPTQYSVIKEAPEVMPKSTDFANLTFAEGYTDGDFPYTLTDNVQNMSNLSVVEKAMRHWHPVVRFNAAQNIGNLATSANLSPLNEDADPDNDLTDPAVDIIVDALQSADARVRTSALMGITGLEGFWPGSLADFKYDEGDYRRMAPYVEAILNREDIGHWELDGAIWAMVVMPDDVKLDNIDRILEILDYPYSWWSRYAAFQAIRRLPDNVEANYALDLVEAYLGELHLWPKDSMSWGVASIVNNMSQYFQNGEREAILHMLGEDLAGGIYPRDHGYQKTGGYNHDAASLRPILEAYNYAEFAQISNELNTYFTRWTNPAERPAISSGQLLMAPLVDYFLFLDLSDTTVLNTLAPIMPGIKAMSVGKASETYKGPTTEWLLYAEDWQNIVDELLVNYQTLYGDFPLVQNYYFTAEPPTIGDPAPFPDTTQQIINYEIEQGSGTSVFNNGAYGYDAAASMTSDSGWSGTGVDRRSSDSLNANLAYITAPNDDKGPSDVTISCWIRLDENLPDSDAHYVAFSALLGFDLGVRRMQVDGGWKNTLFFDSSLWGSSHLPLYGVSDSEGRPAMDLESGKDYFIMFEGIQDDEINLTLMHLYDPEANVWLMSDGNQNPGGARYVSGDLSIGIGSLDSETLDPTTQFPGLIDNAQIWSGTTPLTLSKKLTLAMKGSITDVDEQPYVLLEEAANVDAISAEINAHLAANSPAGSNLTLYYGMSDGGENAANWEHSIILQQNGSTVLSEGEYNHPLSGLNPNSTYYLRAHVQNPTGAMLEFWSPSPVIIHTAPVADDFEAPVANVGIDVLVKDSDEDGFAQVTLDGSASSDNYGIQIYTWTDEQGNVLYSGPNSTIQAELAVGQYLITLTTTDFNNNSNLDQYYVYVMKDEAGAPTADAGSNQVIVDYNRDDARLTYLEGTTDANAVSSSWLLERQEVSTSDTFEMNLPVGDHVLIYTTAASDGSSTSDAVRITVLSEAQAIASWTEIDETDIPFRRIIAAQDFSEIATDFTNTTVLQRSYPSSNHPVNEGLDFWAFSGVRGQTSGLTTPITEYGVTDEKQYKVSSLYSPPFWSYWNLETESIALNGAVDMRISMQFNRSTNPAKSNTRAGAKVVCTLADGTEKEIKIYGYEKNKNHIDNIDASNLEWAEIPDEAVSLYVHVDGVMTDKASWQSIDNIVVTGRPVGVIAPPVVTVTGSSRSGTEAMLKGAITDTGDDAPDVTIYYGLEDKGPTAEGWDSSVHIGTQTGSFEQLVTGLRPGTTYYFRAYAENNAGSSFSASAKDFTTNVIDPIIVGYGEIDLTESSVTLQGEVTEAGGEDPTIILYYGAEPEGTNTSRWDYDVDLGEQSGAFSYALSGLDPGETIFYRFRAVNSEGSDWSYTDEFTTLIVAPSIAASDATAITATSATINGNVTDTGGEIPNVRLFYGSSDVGMSTNGWDAGVDLGDQSGSISHTLTGLSSGEVLYYRLYAENSAGGVFTDPALSFETPLAPPTVVVNAASSVTADAATLNGTITNYGGEEPIITIYYGEIDRGQTSFGWDGVIGLGVQSSNFSQAITGLNPNKSYVYRIYAANSAGGSWSNAETFLTIADETNVIYTIQNGNYTATTTWDGSVIPVDGNVTIQNHQVTYSGSSGSVDLVVIGSEGTSRINSSTTFEEKILNANGNINFSKSTRTLTVDKLTINGGRIFENSGKSNNEIAATTIIGDGDVHFYGANASGLATALAINCTDMKGYNGTIIIGGNGANGYVDFHQDIASADASFGIDIVGDGNRLALSGDLAVTSLTVNGDVLSLGTYTIDTASNPTATDLSNVNGTDYSSFFGDLGGTITVATPTANGPPIVLSSPALTVGRNTATLSGEVTDTGGQPPVITFFYGTSDGGGATPEGWDGSLVVAGGNGQSGTFSAEVYNLLTSQLYYYRIRAVNSAGEDWSDSYASFTTSSATKPEVITTIASNVQPYEATLNGEVTFTGGIAPTVTIYYGTTDGEDIAVNWAGQIDVDSGNPQSGVFSQEVANLLPNRTYYYRAFAENTVGSFWSETTQSFTTAVAAPTVDYPAASNITYTTITLNGEVADTGGEDPVVTIFYDTADGGLDEGVWSYSIDLGTQSSSFNTAISGLAPDTPYYFRVRAANSGGSVWTGLGAFSTPALRAPVVINIAASGIDSRSATLNGEVTDTGGVSPIVRIYYDAIDQGTTAGNWAAYVDVDSGSTQSGTFAESISGLQPNQTYYYRAYAENSVGGDWSDFAETFTTPVTLPDVVTADASNINTTEATLNGEVISTGGVAPDITIFYGMADGGADPDRWDNELILGTQSGAFIRAVDNLNSGTTYYYRARAVNSAGTSWSSGDAATFDTLVAPPMVDNDPATNISYTNATLNGEIVLTGGEAPVVTLYYGESDGGMLVGGWSYSISVDNGNPQSGEFSQMVSGLEPGKSYVFRARAVNSAGEDWSNYAQGFSMLAPTTPTVTNLPATEVGSSSVTLNGEVTDTGGIPPEVWIFYGTDPNNLDTSVHVDGGNPQSGTFAETISGLLPATRYYYRAYAVNSVGGTWADATGHFDTVIGPPIVTNDSATAIGLTLVTFNGEVTSTGGQTPTVTLYYGKTDGEDIADNWDHSVSIGAQPGIFEAPVNDLDFNTQYYYRAYAENSGGFDWADESNTFITDTIGSGVSAYFDNGEFEGTTAFSHGSHLYGNHWSCNKDKWTIVSGQFQATGLGSSSRTATHTDVGSLTGTGWTLLFRMAEYTSGGLGNFRLWLGKEDGNNSSSDRIMGLGGTPNSPDSNIVDNNGWTLALELSAEQLLSLQREGIHKFELTGVDMSNYDIAVLYFHGGGSSGNFTGTFDDFAFIAPSEGGSTQPIVIATGASAVGNDFATLNGEVSSTGGEEPSVTVYYGKTDGEDIAGNWDYAVNLGTQSGSFRYDATDLDITTQYYYRVHAANSSGEDWSDATSTFNTQYLAVAGVNSIDVIISESEINATQPGYHPDDVFNAVGILQENGSETKSDRNLVIGYTLPTLPLGETVDTVELFFEITSAIDINETSHLELDVYMLDTNDPDGSGTEFFYHGDSDSAADVFFVGTTSVTISGNSQNDFIDDYEDRIIRLSGSALHRLKSYYGGDHIPEQTEAFFRFNLDTNPTLFALQRYHIDTGSNETGLNIRTLARTTDYQNWISQNLDAAQQAAYAANPDIDHDGDGMSLIKEFYFARDFQISDSSSLLVINQGPGESIMSVTYQRRKATQGVVMNYEVSSDLSNWTPIANPVEIVQSIDDDIEEVQIAIPASTNTTFYRLVIE
ncbi:DUF6288 domain-containing protein [Rubellicoccus peritrichatus]|uniref:DUF6288 domain-containing protein n=1 Tax=Rubellicoccus peritrichatus TaxID=3080537 RepID=A0AAQ3QQG9_9BACT|nr:DUF6288 domain-containing protein [Puniceicoccus sp. CR14]WOO40238.1 DUF6288 domain-containing protein [Puniceicoccus sp. CR14]